VIGRTPTCFELRVAWGAKEHDLCPEDCPQLCGPPVRYPCRRWSLDFKDKAGLSRMMNEYEKPDRAVHPGGHGPPREEP